MRVHQVFYYLILILIPTQLGYHFWPNFSLVLGRRIDYLSVAITLSDISLFFLALSFIAETKHSLLQTVKKIWKKKKNIFFIPLIFMCFATINTVLSSTPPLTAYMWMKGVEYGFFFWYIIQTKPSWLLTIQILLIPLLFSSMLAIFQFIVGHSVGGIMWFFGERLFDVNTPGIARMDICFPSMGCKEYLRPYATFPHPNVLGGYLAILLILMLRNNETVSRTYSYLKRIALIFGTIALCLTGSRSALCVFICALLIVSVQKKLHPRNLLYFIIPLVFSIPFLFQLVTQLFWNTEPMTVRWELLVAAWSMWIHNPIFGVGLGEFIPHLPLYYPSRQMYFLQPVHNMYMLLLSEIGILGCTLLGIFTYRVTKSLFRLRIPVVLVLPFMMILCLGILDHYPLTLQQGQLLSTWVIAMTIVDIRRHA